MLIRSQNRELLINFNNAPAIGIMEVKGDAKITCSDTNETLDIGSYSTKAKAMKVLDMIQEAYERYEYEKAFKTGLALFETFQMPEDSEVEV